VQYVNTFANVEELHSHAELLDEVYGALAQLERFITK